MPLERKPFFTAPQKVQGQCLDMVSRSNQTYRSGTPNSSTYKGTDPETLHIRSFSSTVLQGRPMVETHQEALVQQNHSSGTI